jgi:hypothetical protein
VTNPAVDDAGFGVEEARGAWGSKGQSSDWNTRWLAGGVALGGLEGGSITLAGAAASFGDCGSREGALGATGSLVPCAAARRRSGTSRRGVGTGATAGASGAGASAGASGAGVGAGGGARVIAATGTAVAATATLATAGVVDGASECPTHLGRTVANRAPTTRPGTNA